MTTRSAPSGSWAGSARSATGTTRTKRLCRSWTSTAAASTARRGGTSTRTSIIREQLAFQVTFRARKGFSMGPAGTRWETTTSTMAGCCGGWPSTTASPATPSGCTGSGASWPPAVTGSFGSGGRPSARTPTGSGCWSTGSCRRARWRMSRTSTTGCPPTASPGAGWTRPRTYWPKWATRRASGSCARRTRIAKTSSLAIGSRWCAARWCGCGMEARCRTSPAGSTCAGETSGGFARYWRERSA